jgi:hypothetical protein
MFTNPDGLRSDVGETPAVRGAPGDEGCGNGACLIDAQAMCECPDGVLGGFQECIGDGDDDGVKGCV